MNQIDYTDPSLLWGENSRSVDPEFKPCCLRQGTLLHFVCLHPGV